MYRIELAPGEETVFRTIEELAVALRNGLVTPRCRIYHNASQKWLPIEFHPHYKKALSLPAARIAEAAAPRTSGHPPPLETLSFAVAPAARPTPAAEPVAEPAPGSPECSDATQSGTGSSAKDGHAGPGAEHSGAGHPSADHWDARYSGAEHPVRKYPVAKQAATGRPAQHSAAQHSVTDHSVTNHSVTDHSVTDHSTTEHSATDRSVTDRSVTENPFAEHPVTEHPATKPRLTEHPATKRPVTNHASTDLPRYPTRGHAVTIHSAVQHPAPEKTAAQTATEHPAVVHPAVEHPAVEHPAAEHSPIEHPEAETPYPAHPAAERAAVEHRFTSHADTAAESPIRAEPAPTPKSNSFYRPDSYLPPSVGVIADDPYVAIAPEPPPAPPVPAAPRRSWSMMPAVQETPELPTISYPEFTPAVEPVAERVSSSRGHRPLQVAVAVLVLAAGGYLARSFYSPVRGSQAGGDASAPAAAVADRPALSKDASAPVPAAVTTKPSPNRPAIVTPTAPASSGFAAALEPRAIASGPAPILPAHPAAAQLPPDVSAADSTVTASIAPPPADMPIDVPALPGVDSLVAQPRSKSDSAMKRILRAVNGGQNPK